MTVYEYIKQNISPTHFSPYNQYTREILPPHQFNNSVRLFAKEATPMNTALYVDSTLLSNGKNGIVFTEDKVFMRCFGENTSFSYAEVYQAFNIDNRLCLTGQNGEIIYKIVPPANTQKTVDFFNQFLKWYHSEKASVISENTTPNMMPDNSISANESNDCTPQKTQAVIEENTVSNQNIPIQQILEPLLPEDNKTLFESAIKIPNMQIKNSIPHFKKEYAVNTYAKDISNEDILFMIDYSPNHDGSESIIFTNDKIIVNDNINPVFEFKYADYLHFKMFPMKNEMNSTTPAIIQFKLKREKTHHLNCKKIFSSNNQVNDFIYFFETLISLLKKYDILGEESNPSFEEKIFSIILQYYNTVSSEQAPYIYKRIDSDTFTANKEKYAMNALEDFCYLLADSTFFHSGKHGLMITFWGIFVLESGAKTVVYFNDIETISADEENLKFTLKNGSKITLNTYITNEKNLFILINEIMDFYKEYKTNYVKYDNEKDKYNYYELLIADEEGVKSFTDDELEKHISLGNPYAAIEKGDRCLQSDNPQIKSECISYYKKAHHPVAYRKIGELYLEGKSIEQNYELAEKYFNISYSLGDIHAFLGIANMHFLGLNKKVDYKKAFQIYDYLLSNVDISKLPYTFFNNIGICYRFGYGCEINYKESEKYLLLAKDKTDYAKYLLAEMYIDIDAFSDKVSEGIAIIDELAARENELALTKKGILCLDGKYGEVNIEKAGECFKLALEKGEIKANYYYSLLSFYFPDKYNGSFFELMEKSANGNFRDAVRDLAIMYQFGFGTKRDIAKARKLFEKAASLGDEYSSEWKTYTKNFLNKIRIINSVYSDSESKYDLFLSKVEGTGKTDNISGYGLNAYIFNYPTEIIKTIPEAKFEPLKRKYTVVEKQLKFASQTTITHNAASNIYSNFFKFSQNKAHGQGMEYAAHVEDLLHFKHAVWKGGDNVKLGADRISGTFKKVEIQSKCYTNSISTSTGAPKNDGLYRLMKGTFDSNGNPLYVSSDNKPMVIEVNSDIYPEYYKAVANLKGKAYADKYVKDSGFTAKQCENMTKFGNIDSLLIDVKLGMVQARKSMLISTVITFGVSKFNGQDTKAALKTALHSGLVCYGTTFATTVLTAQLMKTGIKDAIIVPNRISNSKLVKNTIAKATKGSGTVKSTTNYIKSTTVANVATTLVLSSADIMRMLSGRISKEQLFKNTAITAVNVGAGSVGFTIGAACGSFIPVIGTFIGGFIGSALASSAANSVATEILDEIITDDSEQMLEIFNSQIAVLVEEYILTEDELNYVIDSIYSSSLLTESGLRDIFEAQDRNLFCYNSILPYVEEVCEIRNYIVIPDEEEIAEVLSDIEFSAT